MLDLVEVLPNNLGIVAFLDGTLLKTCRPRLPPGVTTNALQRAQYNGHKKHHGFKFQHVLAPNDIIIGAYGPLDGRRLDAFMLLAPLLPQMADNTITTYRLLQSEEASNRVMSSCRVSVEWGFNLVTNTFQTVDFTRWNRRWMTNPSRQYHILDKLLDLFAGSGYKHLQKRKENFY